jgi:hypothetical protein
MRQWSRLGSTVLATVLGTVMVATSGCRYVNPEYRTFTLSRGIGHVSFEYPSRYQIGKVEVRDEYTDVSLNGPYLGEDKVVGGIGVFINSYSSGTPDPIREAEQDIKDYETPGTFPDLADFRLINRSSMVVGGARAEHITRRPRCWRPTEG